MTIRKFAWLETDTDRVTLRTTRPRVRLRVPDLSAFRQPLAKARVLLDGAAQVEHMLLVQYLYAAMTLKTGVELEKLSADRQDLVRAWRATLTGIAIEEMGHLMSVQNLRLFIGAAPTFEREQLPSPVGVYPFPLELEPLTFRSLSKYILAEAPAADEAKLTLYRQAVGVTNTVHHVGILYALLSILLSGPSFMRSSERDPWDRFVRAVARAKPAGDGLSPAEDPEHWHLDVRQLRPDSLSRQADPADFPTPHPGFFFMRVAGRADARELAKRIGLQGEAPVDDRITPSHYSRFLGMAREMGSGAVAARRVPWWSMPVLRNPELRDYGGAALRAAKSFDGAYAKVLAALGGLFKKPEAARRQAAADLEEQMRELRRVSKDLLALPVRRGCVASPVFTTPR